MGGGPFVSEQSPRAPGSHICLAVFLPLNSICAFSLLPQLPTKPGIRNIPYSFLPPLLYRGIHLPHSITNGKIAALYPSPWLTQSAIHLQIGQPWLGPVFPSLSPSPCICEPSSGPPPAPLPAAAVVSSAPQLDPFSLRKEGGGSRKQTSKQASPGS